MKFLALVSAASMVTSCASVPAGESLTSAMEWQRLPDLDFGDQPDPPFGRAGMCAGLISGNLIVLGGSNFPEPGLTATRGGAKTYYNDGIVLREDLGRWDSVGQLLPRPADQMLSVSAKEALYCIGGMAQIEGASAAAAVTDVYRVTKDAFGQFQVEEITSLPVPVGAPVGGLINDSIYVASTSSIYRLDLNSAEIGWTLHSEIPWLARDEYSSFVMNGELVVAGGRVFVKDDWDVLSDVLAFDPSERTWRRLPDLPAGLAWATGISNVHAGTYVFGGVSAEPFRSIEALRRKARTHPEDGAERLQIERRITAYFDHDPGFALNVWRLDETAGLWVNAGWHPGPAAIKRHPIPYAEGFILAGGEVNPGKRTSAVWYLRKQK